MHHASMSMRDLIERFESGKRIGYEDIARARASGDAKLLNEASLGRVYQHVLKSDKRSMAIMTAYRSPRERTRKENIEAHKKLQSEAQSRGYSFFKLMGTYKECPKGAPDPCPEEDQVLVKEASIAIIGIDKDTLLKLVRKYDQDSAVYLGPETKGEAILIFNSGREQDIGKFHPQKIADVYSRVGKKTFVFEAHPDSFMEALIEKAIVRKSGG